MDFFFCQVFIGHLINGNLFIRFVGGRSVCVEVVSRLEAKEKRADFCFFFQPEVNLSICSREGRRGSMECWGLECGEENIPKDVWCWKICNGVIYCVTKSVMLQLKLIRCGELEIWLNRWSEFFGWHALRNAWVLLLEMLMVNRFLFSYGVWQQWRKNTHVYFRCIGQLMGIR